MVYKNLEKEILDITYSIHFSDDQFEYVKKNGELQTTNEKLKSLDEYIKMPIYSLKLSDLLIRCCTEIEALVKELTHEKDEDVKNTPTVDKGRPLDTGCRIKYLKSEWDLDKKIIIISCPNIFFVKEENKIITPF